MLGAHGKPDRVRLDAAGQQFLFAHLGMGGGCGWITSDFTSATLARREKKLQEIR